MPCADASHQTEDNGDLWLEMPTRCVRLCKAGRDRVFTPPQVAGVLPAKASTAVRVTESCYRDGGEWFRRVDQDRKHHASEYGSTMDWDNKLRASDFEMVFC